MRRDAEVTDDQPTTEADIENVVDTFDTRSLNVGSYDMSQCPLELGVFLTNYGTIKGGQVLAGIATGFNQQTVETVDNRYAATIAGKCHFSEFVLQMFPAFSHNLSVEV